MAGSLGRRKSLSRRRFIGRVGRLAALAGLEGLAAACNDGAGGGRETGERQAEGGQPGQNEQRKRGRSDVNEPTENKGTVGLGIVGLIVRDVGASLDFYRMLGLDIPPGADRGGYHRMQLSNGQTFFWDSYEITRGYDPGWEPSSGNRRVVLEFGFASAQAVDDKYAELTDAGHEGYLSPRYVGEARYALVEDPDGNQIGLRHPASD